MLEQRGERKNKRKEENLEEIHEEQKIRRQDSNILRRGTNPPKAKVKKAKQKNWDEIKEIIEITDKEKPENQNNGHPLQSGDITILINSKTIKI